MKETKKFDRWIGILSISVVCIVAIVFVVMISNTNLAKGTYAADQTNCSCPSGWTLTADHRCFKASDTFLCNESATIHTCTEKGYNVATECVCRNATSNGCTYACTKSGGQYQDATCTTTYVASCYVKDHLYRWWTEKPSADWISISRSQDLCIGCAEGYHISSVDECVKDNTDGCIESYYDVADEYFSCGCQDDNLGCSCAFKANVIGLAECAVATGVPCYSKKYKFPDTYLEYDCAVPKTRASVTFVKADKTRTTDYCYMTDNEDSCTVTAPTGATWGNSGCASGSTQFKMTKDNLNKTVYECGQKYTVTFKEYNGDTVMGTCQTSANGKIDKNTCTGNICCSLWSTSSKSSNGESMDTIYNKTFTGNSTYYCTGGSSGGCYGSQTPGNSGTTPGNSGTTPGNSGTTPGNPSSTPGNPSSTPGNPSSDTFTRTIDGERCWHNKTAGTYKMVYVKACQTKDDFGDAAVCTTKNDGNVLLSELRDASNGGCANSKSESTAPSNPPTGTTGIIIAWIIGLFAIGYSFWYFKRTSTD